MVFGDEEQTLQQGYLTLLNRAGTLSGQAQVAQQALEIVRDQAVAARECCRSKPGRGSGKFNQVSAVLSGVCAAYSDRKPIV